MHDVRMAYARQGAALAQEALTDEGIAGQVSVQDLERHLAVQRRIVGSVDGSKAAGAQLRADLVPPDHQRLPVHRSNPSPGAV